MYCTLQCRINSQQRMELGICYKSGAKSLQLQEGFEYALSFQQDPQLFRKLNLKVLRTRCKALILFPWSFRGYIEHGDPEEIILVFKAFRFRHNNSSSSSRNNNNNNNSYYSSSYYNDNNNNYYYYHSN